MLNLILKYPVLILVAFAVIVALFVWADSGGVKSMNAGLADNLSQTTGLKNLTEKISTPLGD